MSERIKYQGAEWEPYTGLARCHPDDLLLLRKVKPPPMPEIQVGDGVTVGKSGRFVITSNTYSRYSGYSPYGEYTAIEPHEIRLIWRNGELIWERKP